MTTKELEIEIIKAIRSESKFPLSNDIGYLDLIKLIRKLFKKFKDEREYATSTIIGITKELER